MKVTLSKAKRFSFLLLTRKNSSPTCTVTYKITKYFRGLVWSHILYLVIKIAVDTCSIVKWQLAERAKSKGFIGWLSAHV